MSDPMQEIRASFFVECEELLEAMQDGLQQLEDGATDSETINVVFRAVHSIKGGAGAFGLHALVAFAHQFETALDGVRSGTIEVDGDALKLFFQGGDVLADHVRAARDDLSVDAEREGPILAALQALSGDTGEAEEEVTDFQPTTMAFDLGLPGLPDIPGLPPLVSGPAERTLTIRFTPELALFASGNEPLYFFRALRDMGALSVACRPTRPLDDFSAYDAAEPCLAWEATLVTEASVDAVREVFEFVDGLCTLEIVEETAPEPLEPLVPLLPPLSDPNFSFDAPAEPVEPLPLLPRSEPEAMAAPDAPAPALPPLAEPAPPKAKAPVNVASLDERRDEERRGPAVAKPTVRVDIERIDRLVNLVGELVINQAMLSQSVMAAGVPANSPVSTGLDEFLQLTRDIQESVMMIRAQPVKSLFQRMSRIVREAAAAVGKDVRLRTDGDSTEIDKTVIEQLSEPLMHMIRNSVDHGIEGAEARTQAGKPREGVVHLSACHRSGRVVIEISDDGAGINRDRVRAKAIEKGIIAEDAQLSDGDIDMLIFAPGFSTAAAVSNLSGRGVGMDVVKTAIAALGGRITITNVPGQGSTFSISLPLTLAVLDGMVVKVEDETLVVPLGAIVETLTLGRDDIRALGPQTQVVQVRDAFVPLLDLGAELGYRTPKADYAGAIVLLIAHDGGTQTALVVDAIEDQRQVVIKGLHDSYGHVPGVAAATILGDGQIALILDPSDLVANATGHSRPVQQPVPLAG